jgi:hypothetical protein
MKNNLLTSFLLGLLGSLIGYLSIIVLRLGEFILRDYIDQIGICFVGSFLLALSTKSNVARIAFTILFSFLYVFASKYF